MTPDFAPLPAPTRPGRRAALATALLCCLALAPAVLPGPAHAASVQGSGTAATETRTPPAFDAIATQGDFEVVVRQGSAASVQLQADDNLLPLLETVVEPGRRGATLQLRWKRGEGSGWWGGQSIQTRTKVVITVVAPALSAISSSGSGTLRVESFKTPALQLSLSGSGDAKLEALTTDELGIQIAGSGDVSGKGSAGKLKISIAGSGDVSLDDLRADEVTVSIAGSGDAAVNAQKSLKVSIAGSGDVVYSGEAQVKSSVAGSGSVKKR